MTIANVPPYLVGLDLGQSHDFTAVTVAKPDDASEPTYTVGHIERVPLETRYPAIVAHVKRLVTMLRRPQFLEPDLARVQPDVIVVADYTGVGRPVADMLLDAQLDAQLVLVTITGGDSVTGGEHNDWRVPKRDLASVIQRLLQEGRLMLPAADPMKETLTKELTGFRVKINLRGHDSYGAGDDWRSAPHDDLVLALALACWWGERMGAGFEPIPVGLQSALPRLGL